MYKLAARLGLHMLRLLHHCIDLHVAMC
jgi:hypothetical protein